MFLVQQTKSPGGALGRERWLLEHVSDRWQISATVFSEVCSKHAATLEVQRRTGRPQAHFLGRVCREIEREQSEHTTQSK